MRSKDNPGDMSSAFHQMLFYTQGPGENGSEADSEERCLNKSCLAVWFTILVIYQSLVTYKSLGIQKTKQPSRQKPEFRVYTQPGRGLLFYYKFPRSVQFYIFISKSEKNIRGVIRQHGYRSIDSYAVGENPKSQYLNMLNYGNNLKITNVFFLHFESSR